MKRVVTVLMEHFKRWGVDHIFGVPGKAVVPLVLEAGNQGIDYVLARHEAGAGYEAGGYAWRRGLGVAAGTSGPGGTNMITAAGQAKVFHQPVFFLTGHPSMKETGKPLGQDSTFFGTDLVQMFQSVTLFSARVERGEVLKSYLAHAVEKAVTGRRGPVHLAIPYDVLTEPIEPFELPFPEREPGTVSSRLDRVFPLLSGAQRPLLFLGKGVHLSGAYEEVRALAEGWGLPVATTPGGKGTFPTVHPLSLGSYGLGGGPEAEEYIRNGVDLLIVIGTSLSDMSLPALKPAEYPRHVIQFDVEPAFVGKSLPAPTLFIQGCAKTNLQALLKEMRAFAGTGVALAAAAIDSPAEHAGLQPAAGEAALAESGQEKAPDADAPALTARETMGILGEVLPEEATVIGDDGSHSYHAVRHLAVKRAGSFLFDDVFASMGHAIGYSIGAQLASPKERFVCLTGDGCLFMNGSELSTAVNSGANVIFVVLNNGRLDMVNKGMRAHVGRTDGTVFEIPLNVKGYAEAMGCRAFRCGTGDELRRALTAALALEETVVIEAMVDPEELPPTLARG
ncbi:thiamine pyrophosphate-binding protein [Paenibacillus aurantius]|uniref:Thiamine pyrophosphate-binding protein n=1 Tax=Paenibacillus aurantius TaxID=2918900 RepID=A0AA96LAP8_9BACL|nr:thiamine pyrophosphate-binding protein [Paenibacillus aurantius]WNQ10299.1 thiamine pyrophosphate-binding protein [Paenibacillus aurantius]